MNSSIVRLRVGMPLERAFARLAGKPLADDHETRLRQVLAQAEQVWAAHEADVRRLFETMYQTTLDLPVVDAYVSALVPNPISEPVAVRVRDERGFPGGEQQFDFMGQILHQLAHWYADLGRVPTLVEAVRSALPDATEDAALHVVLHGTDFGMLGALYDRQRAAAWRRSYTESRNPDYRYAANQLIAWDIPLDQRALDAITRRAAD
jgi:hypothetical protein